MMQQAGLFLILFFLIWLFLLFAIDHRPFVISHKPYTIYQTFGDLLVGDLQSTIYHLPFTIYHVAFTRGRATPKARRNFHPGTRNEE